VLNVLLQPVTYKDTVGNGDEKAEMENNKRWVLFISFNVW